MLGGLGVEHVRNSLTLDVGPRIGERGRCIRTRVRNRTRPLNGPNSRLSLGSLLQKVYRREFFFFACFTNLRFFWYGDHLRRSWAISPRTMVGFMSTPLVGELSTLLHGEGVLVPNLLISNFLIYQVRLPKGTSVRG